MTKLLEATTELLKVMAVVWGSVVALWIPAIIIALYVLPSL